MCFVAVVPLLSRNLVNASFRFSIVRQALIAPAAAKRALRPRARQARKRALHLKMNCIPILGRAN